MFRSRWMEADDDPLGLSSRSRHARIWLIGGALHVALFAAFLVFPFVRGGTRASDARRAFGPLAACFYGGEPTGADGLALPAGERAQLASLWLSAASDWPARCREPLARVAPDEASLLFPSVKEGEARLRTAVEDAGSALAEAARRRAGGAGAIPVEAIAAVGAVAAALSEVSHAADPSIALTDEVIRFTRPASAPDPARIALHAAPDAALVMRVRSESFEVVSVDQRGVSHTLVGGGRTRAIRMVRPGLVRGALFSGAGPVAVFATRQERCTDLAACSRRSSAVLPFAFEPRFGEPEWLGAHPAGRFDRAVVADDGGPVVLAVGPNGAGLALRQFGAARSERLLSQAVAGVLVDSERALVAEPSGPGDALSTFAIEPLVGERLELATMEGDEPWALTCVAAETVYALLVTASEASLVAVGSEGVRRLAAVDRTRMFPSPFDERDPNGDRVKLVCDARGVALVYHAPDSSVRAEECDANGACAAPIALGRAFELDVARTDGRTLVAFTSEAEPAAVRVRALDETEARVVAGCFSDGEGLCGEPFFAVGDGRVVLVTRERNDLTAIESRDGGSTWRAMEGVR